MSQTPKSYPLHQSPFYKLSSKKKLASLLNISQKELIRLTDHSNYRLFINNGREIQEPIGIRKIIHKRVKELLSRIKCPEYLFSGVKRKSAIANARFHQKNSYIMTADIKSFYKSSRIEYVFRFFHYTLKMQMDTARILSKILCYYDFIPTGSPSSQLLAFWSYSKLFDNINLLSQKHNMIFSLYVDDMTFSSQNRIPKHFDLYINSLLNTVSLGIKKKKTKYYFATDNKIITGCMITGKNELKVQNKHKKKIIELVKKSKSLNNKFDKDNIKKSISCSISQAQQIESEIFAKTKNQF